MKYFTTIVFSFLIPALLLLGCISVQAVADEKTDNDEQNVTVKDLPQNIVDACKSAYPQCMIEEASIENENGKKLYEVLVNLGVDCKVKIEMKYTLSGELIERETPVSFDNLPAAVRDSLEKKYPGVAVKKQEAIDIYFYEIELVGKTEREIKVTASGDILEAEKKDEENDDEADEGNDNEADEGNDDKADDENDEEEIAVRELPKIIVKVVKRDFPKGNIDEAGIEYEDGFKSYELELIVNGRKIDVKYSKDGILLEKEQLCSADNLPIAVRNLLQRKYPGTHIEKIEFIRLDFYEIELYSKNELEIKIDATGKIIDDLDN